VVGERLRQTNLALQEDAARAVADGEGTDDAILELERQRQDRSIRGAFEPLEDRRVVADARVVGEIRRGDGPPLPRGKTVPGPSACSRSPSSASATIAPVSGTSR
jgi:hypothetical protein